MRPSGERLTLITFVPELLPEDRGQEVQGLAEGGATVAVIGKSPVDDVALRTASVSIALAAAGSAATEWSVALASSDVRDAALTLRLAHRARQEARLATVLTALPGLLGVVLAGLGLIPYAVAPVLALMGTAAALLRYHLRAEAPVAVTKSQGPPKPDIERLREELASYMADRGLKSTGQRR